MDKEITTQTDILTIRHVTLQEIAPHSIKNYADELYYERLAKVRYIFLSNKDWRDFCDTAVRNAIQATGSQLYYQLVSFFGIYIAALTSIPDKQEYNQARRTFEYLEHRSSKLQRNEIVTLHEEHYLAKGAQEYYG